MTVSNSPAPTTAPSSRVAEVQTLALQLPAREFLTLMHVLDERAETLGMMQLAESGFQEWNEAGEDLYDGEA